MEPNREQEGGLDVKTALGWGQGRPGGALDREVVLQQETWTSVCRRVSDSAPRSQLETPMAEQVVCRANRVREGRWGNARRKQRARPELQLRWTGQHTHTHTASSHRPLQTAGEGRRRGRAREREKQRARLTWKNLHGAPRSRRAGEGGRDGGSRKQGGGGGRWGDTHTHRHTVSLLQ